MAEEKRNFFSFGKFAVLAASVALPLSLFSIDRSISSQKLNSSEEKGLSTGAKREYFSSLSGLRERGERRQIVVNGELALGDGETTASERAEIHAELASRYEELNDCMASWEHAAHCVTWARLSDHPALEVFGLIKQAEMERFKVHRKIEGASLVQAAAFAEEAIHLYHFKELDQPYLLGKAYYNLGVACDEDPYGSSNRALNAYREASLIYHQYGTEDDLSRLSNHLAYCYLRMGQIDLAIQTLREAECFKKSDRSRVGYAFVWAGIEKARGRVDLARTWAEEAVAGAKQLTAYVSVRWLEEYLSNLDAEVAAPLH